MAKRSIIPFGPQHPVLPEPIHLDLVLEDEVVVEAIPNIGFVHRVVIVITAKHIELLPFFIDFRHMREYIVTGLNASGNGCLTHSLVRRWGSLAHVVDIDIGYYIGIAQMSIIEVPTHNQVVAGVIEIESTYQYSAFHAFISLCVPVGAKSVVKRIARISAKRKA